MFTFEEQAATIIVVSFLLVLTAFFVMCFYHLRKLPKTIKGKLIHYDIEVIKTEKGSIAIDLQSADDNFKCYIYKAAPAMERGQLNVSQQNGGLIYTFLLPMRDDLIPFEQLNELILQARYSHSSSRRNYHFDILQDLFAPGELKNTERTQSYTENFFIDLMMSHNSIASLIKGMQS